MSAKCAISLIGRKTMHKDASDGAPSIEAAILS